MTVWLWSHTADDNDDADGSINLRENQAPSTLNNAMRAIMARIAQWRASTCGTIETGGTFTAYTLTTTAGLTALTNGVQVSFLVHATNGNNPTLNVDDLGHVALHCANGVPLVFASMLAGTIQTASYVAASNVWVVHGLIGQSKYIGEIFDWTGGAAPPGCLFCYGQAISRTTYARLFDVLSTTYGAGDGSSTFNLPDLRGRVIAGQDDMGGSSAKRLTSPLNGDTLGAAGGAETAEADLPAHTHSFSANTNSQGDHFHYTIGETNFGNPAGTDHWSAADGSPIAQQGVGGGDDRQYNLAPSTEDATTAGTSTTGAHTHSVSGTTGSTGGGSNHTNVQPTFILNKCIFTGVFA